MMQRPALAVAIDMGKTRDALLARRKQLLAGKFRRGVQVERRLLPIRRQRFRCEGMQMRLVAGRDLQHRRIHLDKILAREKPAQRRLDRITSDQERTAVGMHGRGPPGGRFRRRVHSKLSSPEKPVWGVAISRILG